MRRCIITVSLPLHSVFSCGLEVAFFGRDAGRKSHVGFGDETGSCSHPSPAERDVGGQASLATGAVVMADYCQRAPPDSLLPPCLAQGFPCLPAASSHLCNTSHLDGGEHLTITSSLCACNNSQNPGPFLGLHFSQMPTPSQKERARQECYFCKNKHPQSSLAAGDEGTQAGAMSVQLPPPQALLTKTSPETASLLVTVLLPPCLEAAPLLEHCQLISSSSLP